MKNMIRFEKVDGIIISMSVENFFEDGSFLTRCILSGKNNSYSYKQYGHTPLNLVTPKVSYGIYEKCEDQKDANILQISYYGGTSSENIVEELRTMLQIAGVQGPYVLVGHSFGGHNMMLYAAKYPDEVVGLVLVDAVHDFSRQIRVD